MIVGLYDLLEGLISARYSKEKLTYLEPLNRKLSILHYQTRLLLDFELISIKRFDNIERKINDIGIDLGGWIKQQHQQLQTR